MIHEWLNKDRPKWFDRVAASDLGFMQEYNTLELLEWNDEANIDELVTTHEVHIYAGRPRNTQMDRTWFISRRVDR